MNTVRTPKHIALWTCPRSRSTLMTRAFEQLDGCVIFDEPLYGAYLLTHGLEHPNREECLEALETDYRKVVQKITGDLPEGASFSFQKHISKHLLPHYEEDLLKHLHSFFLIRNPKEIILSYQKILENVSLHDVGIQELYTVFKKIEALSGETPIVIDSSDFIRNPKASLELLCAHLGVSFSEKMLSWKPKFDDSNLLFTGKLAPFASTWYSTVMNSSGFIPHEEKEPDFPDELTPLLEDCMFFYNKLHEHRLIISSL